MHGSLPVAESQSHEVAEHDIVSAPRGRSATETFMQMS